MKKFLVLLMSLVLLVILIGGCAEAPVEEIPEEESPAAGEIATLGLGIVTSINRSQSLSEDEEGEVENLAMGQVDSVIATAAFDQEGRVVDVIIDTAQTRVHFDEDMQLDSDPAEEILTKKELGDDYDMRRASEIDKEWDEQIEALEEWMVGKTVEEINALDMDNGYPADPDLTTSVTITVTDYLAALEKAYHNAVNVQAGAETLGLGHNISIGRSVGYDADNDTMPMAQVDTVISGTVFNDAGEVAGVLIDTAQTRVNFDGEGQLTSDPAAEFPTKKELGDDYDMRRASEIDKEWDEQIEALEEWMAGKTVEEINALDMDNGYPADPDLTTSVTITVTDYLAALEEAYDRAR